MNFLTTILVGGIAGWLADFAFKSFSFSLIVQIILGIAGAFVGSYLLFVGSYLLDGELQSILGLPLIVSQILEAFIGASVILLIMMLIKKFTK